MSDTRDQLVRVVKETLRDNYANPDDQAQAVVAAVLTEQRERFMARLGEMLTHLPSLSEVRHD